MKTLIKSFLLLLVIMIGGIGEAPAEPSSGRVLVTYIRPYMQGNSVIVGVSSTAFCGTDSFLISLADSGAKETYAAALTALALRKAVVLEASNTTGCTGWLTRLQSIYLFLD